MAASSDSNNNKCLLVELVSGDKNSLPMPGSPEALLFSRKLCDTYIDFKLSNDQAEHIRKMDVVMEALVREGGGSWFPMSQRLVGWRAENRQRLANDKLETFYHHHKFKRVLRSMRQVKFYIYYGYVPKYEAKKRSSEEQDSLVGYILWDTAAGECWRLEFGRKRMKKNEAVCVCSSCTNKKKRKEDVYKEVEAFYADAYANLLNYYK